MLGIKIPRYALRYTDRERTGAVYLEESLLLCQQYTGLQRNGYRPFLGLHIQRFLFRLCGLHGQINVGVRANHRAGAHVQRCTHHKDRVALHFRDGHRLYVAQGLVQLRILTIERVEA